MEPDMELLPLGTAEMAIRAAGQNKKAAISLEAYILLLSEQRGIKSKKEPAETKKGKCQDKKNKLFKLLFNNCIDF